MNIVYVLRSLKDGKRYCGLTNDLDRRLEEHKRGKVFSTRSRLPFIVEYQETSETRSEARVGEKYFKTSAGRRFLDLVSGKNRGG